MLARERQNKIVEMVNANGSVLVKELSEMFEVTEDSIRKDLSLLEKKELLKKTYGGAVRNRVNTHELYVSQRKGKNVEEKILTVCSFTASSMILEPIFPTGQSFSDR